MLEQEKIYYLSLIISVNIALRKCNFEVGFSLSVLQIMTVSNVLGVYNKIFLSMFRLEKS